MSDNYLEWLDKRIRAVSGEVWHSESARQGAVFALVWAREAYVRPDGPHPAYAECLAEALGPGFKGPEHAPGCRGHRHGRAGCLERGCACPQGITKVTESEPKEGRHVA